MNRTATLLLVTFLVVACGKSADEQMREDIAKESERRGPLPSDEPPKPARELPAKQDKPPPDPEPTTPEEIDTARKKAMIDGRDKDVIRFCEMGKVDDKSDPQILLGCTLAACRINEVDKAKAWSKGVAKSKPLLDQAIKTCLANKVTL